MIQTSSKLIFQFHPKTAGACAMACCYSLYFDHIRFLFSFSSEIAHLALKQLSQCSSRRNGSHPKRPCAVPISSESTHTGFSKCTTRIPMKPLTKSTTSCRKNLNVAQCPTLNEFYSGNHIFFVKTPKYCGI